jgi:hypothetical protein
MTEVAAPIEWVRPGDLPGPFPFTLITGERR